MEQDKVGFALLSLKIEQYATFEKNFSESKKSNLTTGLEFKISKEQKQISVFVTFTFEQAQKAFIKIQVSCHFKIAVDAWNNFENESKIIFPKGFMAHLAMLTVGSARGILHAKTEGTKFNKFLLPTINVTSLIKNDIEFSLS